MQQMLARSRWSCSKIQCSLQVDETENVLPNESKVYEVFSASLYILTSYLPALKELQYTIEFIYYTVHMCADMPALH